MQDTLSRRIRDKKGLTEKEQDDLVSLFGAYCQPRTKRLLAQVARWIPDIKNRGIFNRVHIDKEGVSYCAGQSYSDEIRTVRKCLLGN